MVALLRAGSRVPSCHGIGNLGDLAVFTSPVEAGLSL